MNIAEQLLRTNIADIIQKKNLKNLHYNNNYYRENIFATTPVVCFD